MQKKRPDHPVSDPAEKIPCPSSARQPLVQTFPNVEDEAAQAKYVADSVLDHREAGIALRRQAVLFRTAHHSDLLEIELGRRNIPFVKYGGLRFLEAAHVKDVLAILRWAENPRDAVTRQRIRRGVFRSVVDLQAAINADLTEYNANPNPFVWTKSAEAILAKLDRCPVLSICLNQCTGKAVVKPRAPPSPFPCG